MQICELIELADEILRGDVNSPEMIEKIENFYKAIESNISSLKEKASLEGESLKLLIEKHNDVLKLASSMRDHTSQRLRELKKKAKGILAYKDLFPKRVSITRVRKG